MRALSENTFPETLFAMQTQGCKSPLAPFVKQECGGGMRLALKAAAKLRAGRFSAMLLPQKVTKH
jgi:hypothetical protein